MTNRRQTDGHYLFKDIKAGEEKEGQDNGGGWAGWGGAGSGGIVHVLEKEAERKDGESLRRSMMV